MSLSIGTFLQDRYEILDRIGSGGMSDVYKAQCHTLNRLVAIKVLKAVSYTHLTGSLPLRAAYMPSIRALRMSTQAAVQ